MNKTIEDKAYKRGQIDTRNRLVDKLETIMIEDEDDG